MHSSAPRRAPALAPAAKRRPAPEAPVGSPGPAGEDGAPQQVVLDLFTELNAIVAQASLRAIEMNRPRPGVDPNEDRDAVLARDRAALRAEMRAVVKRAAAAALRLTRADEAVVEVTTLSGTRHRAAARRGGTAGNGGDAATADHPWPISALSAQQLCVATEAESGAHALDGGGIGPRSSITVPVRYGEEQIGSVTVTSARPDAFSPAQAAALSHLGAQVESAGLRLHVHGELRRIDREREALLETSETLFRRLFFENPLPMWVIDAETQRFLVVNDAALAKYGYSAEEFVEMTAGSLRRDADAFASDFAHALEESYTFNTRHRIRDGRLIDVEIATGPQEWNGRPAILSIMTDVTERNHLEKQLRDGAFRDPLSGRANRALFTERLRHALAQARRRTAVTAVLVVDVDDFKVVNDSLGYSAGDSVLQATAARLAVTLRPGDTVARLTADEFAVLLEDAIDLQRAVDVADRLHDAFTSPIEFGEGSLMVGVSIGVAVSTTSGPGPEEILRDARLAMQAAKKAGRGRVEVFSPRMSASASERLSLDQDLRHAVDRGELRVFYQPLVSMDSGAIVGCEALVRWQHGTRGLVPPDSFIPLAEEIGMISAIDTWVLRTACAQAAAWSKAGHPDIFMAVNVSGRELGQTDLVDRIEGVLLETGLAPERLEVEITESTAAAQPVEALEELYQLRRAGISVAIDDFGTGYSSLSKLATFPADSLKIDRSFLSGIKSEGDEAPLVSVTIALAHQLGMTVTAEGVETQAQMAYLIRHGCDLLQGYLFSRPVPAEQFAALLAQPPAAISERITVTPASRSLTA